MARQQRLPFNHSTSQTTSKFELIHVDLWGPYHVSTYDNYKYFLTLVDDYTRSTWTHLLSTKSNALQVLRSFINMLENQFNTTVKNIRSDNGLEFTSSEATQFFLDKGIIHQKSCPYTPQQNSVVERKHKHLLETAKALVFQSKLPLRYWGECVSTATHFINRFPLNHLKNKCPYELLYDKKPNYDQLRSFGCLCYPTLPKPLRDKLQPRTTPHIFVGYPFGTKGYKVMSLATKRIHVSRDVIFHEHIFPFHLPSEKCTFPSVLKSIPSTIDFIDERDHNICVDDHRSDVTAATNSLPQHSDVNDHRNVVTTNINQPLSMHLLLNPFTMSTPHHK